MAHTIIMSQNKFDTPPVSTTLLMFSNQNHDTKLFFLSSTASEVTRIL